MYIIKIVTDNHTLEYSKNRLKNRIISKFYKSIKILTNWTKLKTGNLQKNLHQFVMGVHKI